MMNKGFKKRDKFIFCLYINILTIISIMSLVGPVKCGPFPDKILSCFGI